MTTGARWKDVVRPYYKAARSALIVDRNRDWRKAIFVSSGARTGSTWVSQLINFRNEYRYMYEPFFVRPLGPPDLARTLPDNRIQYVRPDDRDATMRRQAEFILSGEFRHPHVDQYNTRFLCDKRLVKEVKSNLWVRWVHQNFPGVPVILLLRHPIPTIMSRFADYFGADPSQRDRFDSDPQARHAHYRTLVFGQQPLVDDHLAPLRGALESAETVMEQRTAVWCIQNYVPLRQFGPGEVFITFYESFCVDAENEIRRLHAFLGEEIDEAGLARFLERVRLPSSNSRYKGKTLDGMKMASSWRMRANDDDVKQAQTMLSAFGLDAIYDAAEPLPNVDAAYAKLQHPVYPASAPVE